jgi:serine/threonine protein phosphatase PrpC
VRFAVGEPGRAAREVVPQVVTSPFGRPDTVLDGGAIGRLEVRAASVRGLARRYYGDTRQDEYCLATDPRQRWLVVGVADGISSGKCSHVAATIAARYGCQALAGRLADTTPDEIDWPALISLVASMIMRQGQGLLAGEAGPGGSTVEGIADAMATVVSYAAVRTHPGEDGGFDGYVYGVGDTSAWLLDGPTGWRLLAGGKDGSCEVSSTQVVGLPYLPDLAPTPTRSVLSAGSALLIASDGIGDPLRDGAGEVGAFLAEVWRTPPDPLTFAGHVSFARQGFDDDRTAVVVWPDP